ncbi:YcxB family protein [Aurantiacibacter hainanensis]|uniref:YcxB family protein n=1 Tax=Aurantiacibacter hainanensis TaxID=3076114 RepID=UPI0030C6B74E
MRAARHVFLARLRRRPALVAGLVYYALVFVLALLPGGSGRVLLVSAFALALPIAVVIVWSVIVPMQARRHYRQSAALREEMEARWDTEHLRLQSAKGESRLAWSDYPRWSETGDLLLLFQSDLLHNLLPKGALPPGQVEEIKSLLTRAGSTRF